MSRTPSPADLLELEDQLRSALRQRAAETPIGDDPIAGLHRLRGTEAPTQRRWRRPAIVAGALAAAAALVVAVGQVLPSTPDRVDTDPTDTTEPTGPALPDADVPRLLVDGATYTGGDGDGASPTADDQTQTLESFRRPGRLDGPMIFLTTLSSDLPYGLLSDENGDPVMLRGRIGYVRRDDDQGATTMSVDLGHGNAIYLTARGFTVAELIEFVDGLTPGPDGGWVDNSAPQDVAEVDATPPAADGRTYGSEFELPDATSIEVYLYRDGFESRLADRVSSTTGPVEMVDIAGRPAALGVSDEWWVLMEPEPGRVLELRITGDRATVDEVLARARFVDEAAWDAATSTP